jgi:hypothetical protein
MSRVAESHAIIKVLDLPATHDLQKISCNNTFVGHAPGGCVTDVVKKPCVTHCWNACNYQGAGPTRNA